jgi:hypothetical protein
MLVGYMRVSTDGDRQVLDLQRDALLGAGVDERHGLSVEVENMTKRSVCCVLALRQRRKIESIKFSQNTALFKREWAIFINVIPAYHEHSARTETIKASLESKLNICRFV